ncbi:hypothetical protein ACFJGW_17465 [Burkholderiaceae bacterium UC74_6]
MEPIRFDRWQCFFPRGGALVALLVVSLAVLADPTASNQFKGTCQDLGNYIGSVGVIDADGVPHPGHASWTVPRFGAGKVYKKGSKAWRQGQRYCMTVVFSTMPYANPEKSIIDWTAQPPACNACGCDLAHSGWTEALNAREEFVAERARVEAGKCKSETYQVTACERSQAALQTLIARKINAAASAACLAKAKTAWRAAVDAYGATPDGSVQAPDCTYCASCATGEVSSCSKPCGGFEQGIYKNCGWSPAQQPVACCANKLSGPGQPSAICSPLGTSVCPP